MKQQPKKAQNIPRVFYFLVAIILMAALSTLFILAAGPSEPELSSREQSYLKGKQAIVVGIDKEFPPFEYLSENDEVKGITIDYLQLMALKLGINFRFVPGTWEKCIDRLQNGEVDMLNNVTPTTKRNEFMDYTKSIFWHTSSIYVHESNYDITGLQDLRDKKVGVKKSSSVIKNLQKNQDIDLEYFPTSTALSQALLEKKVDVIVDYDFPFQHVLYKKDIQSFKRVGERIDREKGTFAVQKGYDILLSLLSKGISSISENEKSDLEQKWFGKPIQVSNIEIFLEKYIHWIIVACLVFLFMILYSFFLQWRVRSKTSELQKSEENLRITLDSIGDAVISTDTDGRIVLFNPVAQKLTGFSLQEAVGRDIYEVFNIVKGQTDEPAENPVKRVLEEGKVVGLANHTVLISKDGSE